MHYEHQRRPPRGGLLSDCIRNAHVTWNAQAQAYAQAQALAQAEAQSQAQVEPQAQSSRVGFSSFPSQILKLLSQPNY